MARANVDFEALKKAINTYTSSLKEWKVLISRSHLITINLSSEYKGSDPTKNLDALVNAVTEGIPALATAGIEIIQHRTSQRLSNALPGASKLDVHTQNKKGWVPNGNFVRQIPELKAAIERKPSRIGNDKVGFADAAVLNRLEIRQGGKSFAEDKSELTPEVRDALATGGFGVDKRSKETSSPFKSLWQIAEFGTGIYAEHPGYGGGARVNDDGRSTKVPGGNGAWYLNPASKRNIILGQKPMHFLFPHRSNIESFRQDINEASEAIVRQLVQVYKGDL